MIHEIVVTLSIGFPTANRTQILKVDIDDDCTVEQINEQKEEMAQEWANSFIEVYWKDKE